MTRKLVTLLCAAVLLVSAVPAFALKVTVGQIAPDFTLKDLDDKEFKLSDYRDKKAVVVVLMQTACSTCKDELKVVQEFVGKSSNYEIVAVNVDARAGSAPWKDHVKSYMSEMQLTMRMLADPMYSVGRLFGAGATPSSVVVGKDGKIVATMIGFTPPESNEELRKVLGGLK